LASKTKKFFKAKFRGLELRVSAPRTMEINWAAFLSKSIIE